MNYKLFISLFCTISVSLVVHNYAVHNHHNSCYASALIMASLVGVTYSAYKTWNYYQAYTQKKLFNDALILLKQASCWANDPYAKARDGEYVIKTLNRLADEGYRPALMYQASHPWLFVDALISEYAPAMNPVDFYTRYAPYSIDRYLLLNEPEGFYRAGCLAISYAYTHYEQGLPFYGAQAHIKQGLSYLDRAAACGYMPAAQELARIYHEGILVPYNETFARDAVQFYATLYSITQRTYPLSMLTGWLYKNYYTLMHGIPVS